MAKLKQAGIRVKYDDSDNSRPGWKFAEYEMKGVPVRIAIGRKGSRKQCGGSGAARYKGKEKSLAWMDREDTVIQLLDDIQQAMFNKAKATAMRILQK